MDISIFLTKLLSTAWFFELQQLIAYGTFVKDLVEGNYSSAEIKPVFEAFGITPEGKKIMMFDYEDDDEKETKPESIFDQYPEGTTLIVPLKGPMFKENTWWSWGTEYIASVICEAAAHPNIIAIVLDVDSGGGAVDSISPLLNSIWFAKTQIPVVGCADVAASAAYYTISACNEVIGSNDISSQFGSVGVMMSFWDIAPYWEKLGLKQHVIYAPESDYKNGPFENALKGDYKLIKKELLSPLAKKFQSDVRSFRNGKIDITQKGILNGKMYFANDAVKYGLADKVGNLDFAIKRANELAFK